MGLKRDLGRQTTSEENMTMVLKLYCEEKSCFEVWVSLGRFLLQHERGT